MNRNGYSEKINDPAFTKYYESTERYSWIFAWILAIALTGGFFVYGASNNGDESILTLNENIDSLKNHFQKTLIVLSHKDKLLRVINDNTINCWGAMTQEENFYKVGDTWNSAPDHHAHAEYQITDFNDERIIMAL